MMSEHSTYKYDLPESSRTTVGIPNLKKYNNDYNQVYGNKFGNDCP